MWRCLKEIAMKVLTTSLLVAAAFMLHAVPPVRAQPMIDLSKDEVQVLVKENYKEFRRDNLVVNQHFNYLKYVNGLGTRTWILYFNEKNLCKSTKLVCDYGEYNEALEELNSTYEKTGKSEWNYLYKGDTIQVILTREEWYFTLREVRKE
jgi:hypothetical protein